MKFERSKGEYGSCSAYSSETWLENYEKGFKYASYDLTILQVNDRSTTIKALLALDMQYAIPEGEHGVEWRIPKHYTAKDMKRLLLELPCTFEGQTFWHRVEVFDHINQTKCCEYFLAEHSTS